MVLCQTCDVVSDVIGGSDIMKDLKEKLDRDSKRTMVNHAKFLSLEKSVHQLHDKTNKLNAQCDHIELLLYNLIQTTEKLVISNKE